MTAILLDTNILVYAFDRREAEKRTQAMKVILELQSAELGCLSVQNLSEFINATTRGAEPLLSVELASAYVEDFRAAFPVFPLTVSIVLEALRGVREHQLSYFDAQLWGCAKLNQVPFIFSEDFQDGQTLEGVRFVNPFAQTFQLEKWL
jgi:predicted nucleic acid-binding protein